MPVYEYECSACGEKFEVRRSIFAGHAKPGELKCPKCGSEEPRRVFSSFMGCDSGHGSCSTESGPHRSFG
jgi:putative FmdB family regulatory protein